MTTILNKIRSMKRWQVITGLTLISALGAGAYFLFRDKPEDVKVVRERIVQPTRYLPCPPAVCPETKTVAEKPALAYNPQGRVGLEGDVRCFEGGKEVGLERKLAFDSNEISYEPVTVETGKIYRCEPAVSDSWFGHNHEYEGVIHNVRMFAVGGDDRSKQYPVHGFKVSRRQVEFSFDSSYGGDYSMLIPVFGARHGDDDKRVSDVFLGERELTFSVRQPVVFSGSVRSSGRIDTGTATDVSGMDNDGRLDPFGSGSLEAGR